MSTVKESGDDLNPPAVVAVSRSKRSATDYLALAIATCGVGYFPIAPGTMGSLVGLALFVWVRSVVLDLVSSSKGRHFEDSAYRIYYSVVAIELFVVLLVTLVGTWAASRTERLSGKKDPGKVVIDEVAGQYLALIAVPFASLTSAWPLLVLAFILFRFFDIVKPYPARKMESLPGGLGIMADDIVAGLYAAIVVAIGAVITRSF
ncbi:MAG TPA: phosphatidylglycerophosphatase A [Pyrinomonadaceae bacterium]|jgi:phosphatidylglycerophosphatase A|nr:phosphatidylglycerophosphatase A [Pyrinomonadaceae bacterium]